VVAKDLGEDLLLQPPIKHLVPRPHPPLHSPILRRIHVVPWTFDFVGVAAVPLVGLEPLARLEEVTQNLVKNLMSVYLPAGYGPWIQKRFPARMSTPSS
jgi:hypothetical protein